MIRRLLFGKPKTPKNPDPKAPPPVVLPDYSTSCRRPRTPGRFRGNGGF